MRLTDNFRFELVTGSPPSTSESIDSDVFDMSTSPLISGEVDQVRAEQKQQQQHQQQQQQHHHPFRHHHQGAVAQPPPRNNDARGKAIRSSRMF